MQSDPQDEFDEILLKARAPMSAIAQAVTGSLAAEAWRCSSSRASVPARWAGRRERSRRADRAAGPPDAHGLQRARMPCTTTCRAIAVAVCELLLELGGQPPPQARLQEAARALLEQPRCRRAARCRRREPGSWVCWAQLAERDAHPRPLRA